MPTINDRDIKTISKLILNGDLMNIIDEGCRSQIDSLENRIKDLEEIVAIIQSEIKEINKKLNNETFNFN